MKEEKLKERGIRKGRGKNTIKRVRKINEQEDKEEAEEE